MLLGHVFVYLHGILFELGELREYLARNSQPIGLFSVDCRISIDRSSVQVQTWEPMTAHLPRVCVLFINKKVSSIIINLEVKKGRDNSQLKKKEIDNDRHLHIHPWTQPFSNRVISAGSGPVPYIPTSTGSILLDQTLRPSLHGSPFHLPLERFYVLPPLYIYITSTSTN